MPFVDTPLTDQIRHAARSAWGVPEDGAAHRLYGGEESAAFRVGRQVIRIGPKWRTSEELEWCHAIARAAAEEIPEALAPVPLRSRGEATVVRVAGHPVSVWPFIEGTWTDDDDEDQWRQAAGLLARLHRALAARRDRFGPRPTGGGTVTSRVIEDGDDDLEQWLCDFDGRAGPHQPLHGDFYAGNMLTRDRRIVALLDWDEAIVGPPERELAWAAWEFGDGLWADDLDAVRDFICAYRDAGGPATAIDELTLRQLVRQRLRGEIHYVERQAGEVQLTAEDIAYQNRQREMLERLRP